MAVVTAAEKLRINPGTKVWTSDPGSLSELGALPAEVTHPRLPSQSDVALIWAQSRKELEKLLDKRAAGLALTPVVWVLYPQGEASELGRDAVRQLAEHHLRPVSRVSVSASWAAVRVRPLKNGEDSFDGVMDDLPLDTRSE